MNDAQRELITINYNDIIFDEGIYPRVAGHDPARVQEYAQDIEQIESAQCFIAVNAENKLLDGRHRMLAYKKNAEGATDFHVQVWKYAIASPLESFKLACFLQDKGKSLEKEDREASAKKLYGMGAGSQKDIAAILSVTPGRVSQWLSRTIKEEKERNKKKVFDLWLACETLESIAETVGINKQSVTNWVEDFSKSLGVKDLAKFQFQDDFQIPIYNVWKLQTKSNRVSHFGNSEQQWLENLLYLYTEPFDIVVDPFAGGGSTIDVCKKRGRRYYVSDRKPIVEREHEIRLHDLTTGLPSVPRWKDVKLVYLDPPYWKQAEGQYSDDPEDLANMSLEQFNGTLSMIITEFGKKLSGYDEPKYIALIIQPTQWKSPEKAFTDHVGEMLRAVNISVNMRYSVPYESQQCTAQMVEWSKQNKTCLVLTREIIVWEVR
jgi:transposase-like protein